MTPRPLRILAAIVALLVFLGGIQLIDDDKDGRTDRVIVPVPRILDTTDGTLPPAAKAPADVRADQRDDVQDGTYDTSRVLEGATAQPARWKCYTPRNGGARALSAIGLGVAHITVSGNVPGTGDVRGICNYFQKVNASATWIVDMEGNSAENVPLDRVPWTQAWFNRPACSIEFINRLGNPFTEAAYRESGRLFAKCFKLAGIPVRSGRVNGSTGSILRTGLVTHQELGAKGGGHSDPGARWDRALQLYWIGFYAGAVTNTDRITCRKLNAWRKAGRPKGGAWERNSIRRRRALQGRGVACTTGGPSR